MKIGQFVYEGEACVFVINDSGVFVVDKSTLPSTKMLLDRCQEGQCLSNIIRDYEAEGKLSKITESEEEFLHGDWSLLSPVTVPEAWAVGVTYRRQATEHDKDLRSKQGKTDDLYTYVYENDRAEVFFKGLGRTIVGSTQTLMLRADSQLVMPEGEFVLILGATGMPVAYTLGNDLTAWDIESECPLYLSQAKVWSGSGSIGPYIIPVECIDDPYSVELRCTVTRDGELVLDSSGSTSGLKRSLEELCYFLKLSNDVESGTVLYTGTTCVIDHDFGLRKGDIVEISSPSIGSLMNRIDVHELPERQFNTREGIES